MKKEQHHTNLPPASAIDDQTLMAYLNDSLTQEEKHGVEEAMVDDIFTNDAIEGLQAFKHRDISAEVDQLKKSLQKKLQKKQARKIKRDRMEVRWTYIALILLFLTLLVSYAVLRIIA